MLFNVALTNRFFIVVLQIRSPSAMSNRSAGYLPGPQEPEIHVIKLHKSNNGMGLSIVAAKVGILMVVAYH